MAGGDGWRHGDPAVRGVPARFGDIAPVDSPEFWFAMQLAMLSGFATAYPVNGWLIRTGLKEKM